MVTSNLNKKRKEPKSSPESRKSSKKPAPPKLSPEAELALAEASAMLARDDISPLARSLFTARAEYILSGAPLLTAEELEQEILERRGGYSE